MATQTRENDQCQECGKYPTRVYFAGRLWLCWRCLKEGKR